MKHSSLQAKINCLETVKWDYKTIATYCECGQTLAYKILNDAKAKYGAVKYFPNCVHRDNVLQILGINAKEELELLRGNYEKNIC